MDGRTTLTRRAMRTALEIRRKLRIGPADPVCAFDLAEELGVTVLFTDEASSMEGMYLRADRPHILVCSLRPAGRQATTCAHELGHHVFGHGSKVDEFLAQDCEQSSFDPEEWLADRFANFLLMPKAAVLRALRDRGADVDHPDPQSVFAAAGQLGVGYETLVRQLAWSLGCVSSPVAEALLKRSPKQIRIDLVGPERAVNDVVVVDVAWIQQRPIDLQVGDHVLLPPGVQLEGNSATVEGPEGGQVLIRAVCPGIARLFMRDADWACFVRVSRRQYVGLAQYRHLEDPDHD